MRGLTVIFRRQFSLNAIATCLACSIGLAAGLAPSPAHALDLTVVHQTGQEFICMFAADCSTGTATGAIGFAPPEPTSDHRLFASSFGAKPGSPGDGTTVYLYRVDLTADAEKFAECVSGVVLNFGPLAQVAPVSANTAHVYIITTGDSAGSILVKSAEQDGDYIQLNFDGAVCPSKSSLMFVLPSKFAPAPSRGVIFGYGHPPVIPVTVIQPKHATTPSPSFGDPE
jgi:hypothetical protein